MGIKLAIILRIGSIGANGDTWRTWEQLINTRQKQQIKSFPLISIYHK